MSRRPIPFVHVIIGIFISGLASLLFVAPAWAINDAPADAAVVNLRTSCTEDNGNVEIPNCFTTIAAVDNWLRNVRQAGPTKPTLVDIGPGSFGSWVCQSSNVTLRGAGRDRTELVETGGNAGITVSTNCTNLNVQDLTLNGSQAGIYGGVRVGKLDAVTAWTNVDIVGSRYGWLEEGSGGCQSHAGRHSFFSSRITAVGKEFGSFTNAYSANCAASWFWGSEITANVTPGNEHRAYALLAVDAEVHLYGSNARLLLQSGVAAAPFSGTSGTNFQGTFLMTALAGSSIHIHGTGLDVIHAGTGTADMLYADATSHFHANESGFNIHVTGTGKVNRVAGAGTVETPYIWGAGIAPPLSESYSSVQTLVSRNGMDSYMETDCPLSANQDCSAGASLSAAQQYPRLMVYRKECTGTGANQGPWFDTVRRACRN
jgi:hypothetical protein